jgi:hypothetical protein
VRPVPAITYDLRYTWNQLVEVGRTPMEASTDLAQALFKSMRIPERLQRLPDGTLQLEAQWEGEWEPVDCTPHP